MSPSQQGLIIKKKVLIEQYMSFDSVFTDFDGWCWPFDHVSKEENSL